MIDDLFLEASKRSIPIEVYRINSKGCSIKMFEKELETYEVADVSTYNIKAKINNKIVQMDLDNINNPSRILDTLESIAISVDDESEEELAKNEDKIDGIETYTELDLNQVVNDFIEIYKLKDEYRLLDKITLYFNSSYVERAIINSLGTDLKDSNYIIDLSAEVIVKDGEKVQTGYFELPLKKYDIQLFKRKTVSLIEDTITKLNCSSQASSKYKVLLNNECVYEIINSLSEAFTEEQISKKVSPFTDKYQKKIFSDKITIVEDPSNSQYIGKRLFDDEGTPTYFKKIVEKGVFTSKLYNNKYASKANTTSTGNSYGVRNMYITPGNKTNDELLEEMKNGILIDNIEGLHAGFNKTTGNFSLQAEGYLIENGKKVKPLNMIVISTDIFELLSNVIEVGNDLEFFSINGGAPSLLVDNITIAGKD